jgi:small nuclear ribonucleoprotein (snRNP)-like protein
MQQEQTKRKTVTLTIRKDQRDTWARLKNRSMLMQLVLDAAAKEDDPNNFVEQLKAKVNAGK